MKTKIFNIESGTNEHKNAEIAMDLWFSENPTITITNIVFNANEFRFILIIFYTENKL